MPDSFYCKACKVAFAVGWFHYHGSADGLGAETLLVCSACGTMHTVVHPDPVRIPVLGGLFHRTGTPEKLDRLMAQAGPCFVNGPEDHVMERLQQWRECETKNVLCPKSKYAYMKGFIDLGPVKCNHCGRQATLVQEWSSRNVRCPACGKSELSSERSWIT
jgi:ribosomal protein S27E